MSNWKKTVVVLLLLVFLMLFPPTRQFLLFVLPLGSGIDDLIFFVLLFVLLCVVLIRFADVDTVFTKLKNWFSK